MVETFHRFDGHSDWIGWSWIGGAFLLAWLGWKKRMLVGPALAAISGVVFLATGADNSLGGLLIVPFLVGSAVDHLVSPRNGIGTRRARLIYFSVYLALAALWFWSSRPFQFVITFTDSDLRRHSASSMHKFQDTLIAKIGLQATLERADFGGIHWRFRNPSTPDEMIAIDAHDRFRDDQGVVWSGDQLGQRIAEWAGATPQEKHVRDLASMP